MPSTNVAFISGLPAARSTVRPTPAILGNRSFAICRQSFPSKSRRCRNKSQTTENSTCMIRVALPFHLRNLAKIESEVELDLAGPVTQRAILDALDARY